MLGEMTVIDISQQLPGPYASALLASLGADVTKVEPPQGDIAQRVDRPMYDLVNAGKRIITLDLKSPSGVAELHRLVADADVLIEGFRPGVAARLGASWEVLCAINPRLVLCSISAAGQEGPLSAVPMHDLNLQGIAGIDPGQGIAVPWVDLGTGTSAALAVLAAWHAARVDGRGRWLDAAMLDTAVLWGTVKADAAGRLEPTYGTFDTRDGRVAVAILEDHIWLRLCEALDWSDWRDDSALAHYRDRVGRAAEISDRLSRACALRETAAVLSLADRHDLPITTVGAPVGTASWDHLAARGLLDTARRQVPLPTCADALVIDEGVANHDR